MGAMVVIELHHLLEPQRYTPAKQAREADVRTAEDRFKVVEEQLVRQVLDVELKVERRSLVSQQIRTDGEIEDSARANASALEVNLVVEPWVEALTDEIGERRARLDIGRNP